MARIWSVLFNGKYIEHTVLQYWFCEVFLCKCVQEKDDVRKGISVKHAAVNQISMHGVFRLHKVFSEAGSF